MNRHCCNSDGWVKKPDHNTDDKCLHPVWKKHHYSRSLCFNQVLFVPRFNQTLTIAVACLEGTGIGSVDTHTCQWQIMYFRFLVLVGVMLIFQYTAWTDPNASLLYLFRNIWQLGVWVLLSAFSATTALSKHTSELHMLHGACHCAWRRRTVQSPGSI